MVVGGHCLPVDVWAKCPGNGCPEATSFGAVALMEQKAAAAAATAATGDSDGQGAVRGAAVASAVARTKKKGRRRGRKGGGGRVGDRFVVGVADASQICRHLESKVALAKWNGADEAFLHGDDLGGAATPPAVWRGVCPQAWTLPWDVSLPLAAPLVEQFRRHGPWVVKRDGSSGGKDIFFLASDKVALLEDIIRDSQVGEEALPFLEQRRECITGWVLQQFVEKPMLVCGHKYTLRVFTVVLRGRVFVYDEYEVRLAPAPYDVGDDRLGTSNSNSCSSSSGSDEEDEDDDDKDDDGGDGAVAAADGGASSDVGGRSDSGDDVLRPKSQITNGQGKCDVRRFLARDFLPLQAVCQEVECFVSDIMLPLRTSTADFGVVDNIPASVMESLAEEEAADGDHDGDDDDGEDDDDDAFGGLIGLPSPRLRLLQWRNSVQRTLREDSIATMLQQQQRGDWGGDPAGGGGGGDGDAGSAASMPWDGEANGWMECCVLGHDILVDEAGRPWLLESNHSPAAPPLMPEFSPRFHQHSRIFVWQTMALLAGADASDWASYGPVPPLSPHYFSPASSKEACGGASIEEAVSRVLDPSRLHDEHSIPWHFREVFPNHADSKPPKKWD